MFQKNNKIVIKGNTYTIGYYNWTDFDWDIDAKRPTFDKQQYVTSQSVKKSLEQIPPILKHGLTTTSDNKLKSENDFFSVTAFDSAAEAIKKDSAAEAIKKDSAAEAIKAKESSLKEVLKGSTSQNPIEVLDDDEEKSRLESNKLEKQITATAADTVLETAELNQQHGGGGG